MSRLIDGREPRFDLDYALGRQAEEYVARIAADLATRRVEVKASPFARTNLYVESRCLHADGQWRRSGLAVTEAETVAWCIGDLMLAAPTEAWRAACRRGWPRYRNDCLRGDRPTVGLSIPFVKLVPWLLDECRRDEVTV